MPWSVHLPQHLTQRPRRLITVGVFLGLTLFTFQSKYDFSGMGSWLFAGLIGLSEYLYMSLLRHMLNSTSQ